jgi:alpha-methylacyl-CoA racemase
VDVDGVVQAAPAPRFSRSVPGLPSAPAGAGEHTEEALVAWGFDPRDVEELRREGAVRQR